MADGQKNKTRGPHGAAKSTPEFMFEPAMMARFEHTEEQKKYLRYLIQHKEDRMLGYEAVGGSFTFVDDENKVSHTMILSVSEAGGLFKAGNMPTMSPAEVLAFAKQKRLEEEAQLGSKMCAGCGRGSKEGKNRCSGCKKVYYCNEECQRRHWTHHRDWCASNQN